MALEQVTKEEYGKFAIATEVGAVLGSIAGIYLSDFLTENNLLITGGSLSGDYIGGTAGMIMGFYHNNKDDYKNALEMSRDAIKMMFYDAPITTATYVVSGNVMFNMLENNYSKPATLTASTIVGFAIWHTLTYMSLNIIKNKTDEKIVTKITKNINLS